MQHIRHLFVIFLCLFLYSMSFPHQIHATDVYAAARNLFACGDTESDDLGFPQWMPGGDAGRAECRIKITDGANGVAGAIMTIRSNNDRDGNSVEVQLQSDTIGEIQYCALPNASVASFDDLNIVGTIYQVTIKKEGFSDIPVGFSESPIKYPDHNKSGIEDPSGFHVNPCLMLGNAIQLTPNATQATFTYHCSAQGTCETGNSPENPAVSLLQYSGNTDAEAKAFCDNACGIWPGKDAQTGGRTCYERDPADLGNGIVLTNLTELQQHATDFAKTSYYDQYAKYYPSEKACLNDSYGIAIAKNGSVSAAPSPTPIPIYQTTPTPTPFPPPCQNTQGQELINPETGKCPVFYTVFGGITTDPGKFIGKIFGILLGISGGIAVLLIIRSGYLLTISRGDTEKLQEAREVLTAAIVGLLFIIFCMVILEVVGVDILKIPGFSAN